MAKKKQLKKTPGWVSQPFASAAKQGRETIDVAMLASEGIARLTKLPGITKALVDLAENDTEIKVTKKDLARDKETAKKAEEQLKKGIPLLTGMVLNSSWSMIESTIKVFLVNWLENEPSARDKSEVKNIKVPLFALDGMDEEEKCIYLIDELQVKSGAIHKKGAGRFETLLGIFGLGGRVGQRLAKDILELQQVRNVFSHRHGIADRKLLQVCPWLDFGVGELISPTGDQMNRYMVCGPKYLLTVKQRAQKHLGIPV